MATASYDCIVIGSGPGGYVTAIRAAQLGMKTACVEKDLIGGRCLNVACIPAKAVLRSADVLQEIRDASEFGIEVGQPKVDFAAIMKRRGEVVSTLTGGVAMLLKKHSVDVFEGSAALNADGTVTSAPGARGTRRLPRDRLRTAAGPGHRLGDRVVGTEEAGPSTSFPGRWPSSAPARRQRNRHRVRAPRRGRSSSSRHSTACCRSRMRTSRRSPHAASRSRASTSRTTKTLVTDVATSNKTDVTFKYGDADGAADWLVIAAGRGPDVDGLGLDITDVVSLTGGLVDVAGGCAPSIPKVYAIGDIVHGPALARGEGQRGGRRRRRARGRNRTRSARVRRHPRARRLLHAERRQLRADRGAGQESRATTWT